MYKHTWHVAPDGANRYLVALAINMLLLQSKDSEPSIQASNSAPPCGIYRTSAYRRSSFQRGGKPSLLWPHW